jgi:hypothetical protein
MIQQACYRIIFFNLDPQHKFVYILVH